MRGPRGRVWDVMCAVGLVVVVGEFLYLTFVTGEPANPLMAFVLAGYGVSYALPAYFENW